MSTEKENLSAENDNFDECVSEKEASEIERQILNMFREQMEREETKRMRKRSENETDAMISTCSEFLNSFIILGYDLNNECIQPIFYAKNRLEADALANHLQTFATRFTLSRM